jgi:hypothetical protein
MTAPTFPRALPAVNWLEQPSFDLMPVEGVNRAGGSVQTMELADPFWSAKFVTEPLNWANRALLSAWKDSLRGGKRFFGFDPFRQWPAFYKAAVLSLTRAGGGAFDGTAKVTANGTTTVALATLPASYHVSEGDMVELPRDGGLISLHQVIDVGGVVASGGGATTVVIDPPAPADVTINATTVRLVKPRALMVIVPGSYSAPAGVGRRSVSFDAVSVLK